MIINTAEELFSASLNFISLNELSIEEAKERFLAFQKSGVIKTNCTFDDNVWYTTDEYSNVGLHFDFNIFTYKQYEEVFNLPLDSFITHLKAYLVSIFGRNALVSIQTFLLDMRHITSTNIQQVCDTASNMRITRPNICIDFFSMLSTSYDNEQLEQLINAMDSYADINFSNNADSKRTLADFDTYFLFGDIIKDYWNSDISEEDRLFYYPVYLWWMITGVLPLRPREFLLTQRNCLSNADDGNYYLKLRRNQLKGDRDSGPSYKISDDYVVETYKIPKQLGDEIQKYITLTEQYEKTDIDTLFITDPHYKKWGQKKHSDSRFLTYMNMNTILKYFYKEVIHERYGFNVCYQYENKHLADGDICYIHLGDTRHISLINIMQEGGTPTTAMFLAGHTNTDMSSHYYSNLQNMIECKTYKQYRRMISGHVQYQVSTSAALPQVGDFQSLNDGGRCYSAAYQNGDINDCLCSVGPNGEIGYCPNCSFYRKNGISFFGSDDIYKRQLKDDCEALKNAIELVRHGNGDIEDIGEVLLKLHSSSISYEAYLMEKYKHTEE